MSTPAAVESLLEAVKQLPPNELAKFTAGFKQWHALDGAFPSEAVLIEQTKQTLPNADQKRLRKLAVQSERQDLAPADLKEYRKLAEREEQLNACQVQALAELAHRRNQPIQQVKQEIGWQEPRYGL